MLILIAAFWAALSAPTTALAPTNLSPFRMIVEQTAKGWRLQCDSGCAWTELSVGCNNGCGVRIDASGLSRDLKAPVIPGSFAFTLERAPAGWRASSLAGTSWLNLSWQCRPAGCPARLDASGVGPR